MECVARMERILDVVRENAKIGGFAVKGRLCGLVRGNSRVGIRFDHRPCGRQMTSPLGRPTGRIAGCTRYRCL